MTHVMQSHEFVVVSNNTVVIKDVWMSMHTWRRGHHQAPMTSTTLGRHMSRADFKEDPPNEYSL